MSRSTISTFQLFALFPDEQAARVYSGRNAIPSAIRASDAIRPEAEYFSLSFPYEASRAQCAAVLASAWRIAGECWIKVGSRYDA